MMNVQKNSRPAGTEATENAKPEKILREHYTTNLTKKQALFACTFVMVALIIVGFIFPTEKTELVPVEHKVRQGETLDSIALHYDDPNDDIVWQEYRAWVHEHNESGFIYPGDTVIVGVAK